MVNEAPSFVKPFLHTPSLRKMYLLLRQVVQACLLGKFLGSLSKPAPSRLNSTMS